MAIQRTEEGDGIGVGNGKSRNAGTICFFGFLSQNPKFSWEIFSTYLSKP